MIRNLPILLICLVALIIPQISYSVSIDWHGFLGFDTSLIDNYRKIEQTTDQSNLGNTGGMGTQEVPLASGNHANASFQTYLFHLDPVIIINDAASIKGEITNGYGRGGRLGEDSVHSKEPGYANALYSYNTSSGNKAITINRLYMELYSDTATYLIGRHSNHWGLGALIDSGEDAWDRHVFVRDGLTMKVKIGNFHVSPFWAKISAQDSLTRATKVKEYGFSILYDNIDRDIAFGILYSKKENSPFNGSETTAIDQAMPAAGTNPTTKALGKTDVKITDLFIRKKLGDFSLALEVPIISGEIGYLYSSQNQAKYKAKAFILETSYALNNSWSFGINGGKVSGDPGSTGSFDAMYLNPNYQIANLLFRYNLRAVSDPNQRNLFDSYITNTNYAKLAAHYKSDKWGWDGGLIYAKAQEVAKANSYAFNHTTNRLYWSQDTQSEDLGLEVDSDVHYFWNNEITVTGSVGYLFAGDYFAFTNDPTIKNSAKDSYILQLKVGMDF